MWFEVVFGGDSDWPEWPLAACGLGKVRTPLTGFEMAVVLGPHDILPSTTTGTIVICTFQSLDLNLPYSR